MLTVVSAIAVVLVVRLTLPFVLTIISIVSGNSGFVGEGED